MGLGSDMKNLSENLLASFKERIRDNEELVNEVQKTLDGFRKDHQDMADILKANAAALRKGLANGEKDRMKTFKHLMTGIEETIASIQNEVVEIQNSTLNMINEFAEERTAMADELNKSFAQGRAGRVKDNKNRLKEFDALMKNINSDIKSINNDVLTIFKNTNDMIARFDKEHHDMSAELRAELSKNLSERVEYTRTLLNGFQKRLSDISKENQKMAQKLRKDLANGETDRMNDFNSIMKGIDATIKEIRKDVGDIQAATNAMLTDLSENRTQASAEWSKMQDAMAQIRKTGVGAKPKPAAAKAEKKEAKIEAPVIAEKKTAVVEIKEAPVKPAAKPKTQLTLDEKVLDFINTHPNGVRISEMEEPLGETRMKLGFVAKNLLDEGKVLKIETVYYPKTRKES